MHLSWKFINLLAVIPTLACAIHVPRSGTVIPLTKRSNGYVDDQGTVNATALTAQIKNTENKLIRGFEAYQRNTGTTHPAQPQRVKPRNTGSAPLTDDNQILWSGTISIGTPSKPFTVQFDTGSSDLFIPGPECGDTCSGHQVYNPSNSKTSKSLDRSATLGFGDESTVECQLFEDTVSIGGLTAKNQAVGAATQYSSGFELARFPPDGLMGMAFPQISVFRASPVFQTLVAQQVPTAAEFGITLAESGPELFLGGVDNSKFTGDFVNVPVKTQGFWQVNMDSIIVNGKTAFSNLEVAVDTGTTLIVAPQGQATQFYQAIAGSMDASATLGAGFFTFPCDSEVEVSLTFGGKQFSLASGSFNLGADPNNPSQCLGAITGSNNVPDNLWVVGDIFLASVYTKFDVANSQVGFAQLA